MRGKLAALVLAVIVAAAPFGGVVCTMACGEGGSACCCTSGGDVEGPVFSKPSCCASDIERSPGTSLAMERSSRSTSSPASLQISRIPETGSGDRADSGRSLPPARKGARARPSPLFLLNASFII